jgi:Ice-binding-like
MDYQRKVRQVTNISGRASRRHTGYFRLAPVPVLITTLAVLVATQSPAAAATAPVILGNAGSFGVLAATTVTSTGGTVVNGDLGVSPGTAVTGFPPGTVNGTVHSADAAAASAQTDLTGAYTDAVGRTPSTTGLSAIGNQTLGPGVYNASSSLGVGGILTLDGQGNTSSVFIFQIGSTLTTDSASSIVPVNGAQACNIFWQVGSSATLGTGSTFLGSILALTSITVTTGDTINGRALARNGAVTLDDDTINVPPPCPETPIPAASPPIAAGAAGTAALAWIGWFLVRRRKGRNPGLTEEHG